MKTLKFPANTQGKEGVLQHHDIRMAGLLLGEIFTDLTGYGLPDSLTHVERLGRTERGKTYQNKLNLHLGWNCNLEIPIKHPAWCGVVNVKTGLGCTWLAGWPPNPACPVASSPASRIKGY